MFGGFSIGTSPYKTQTMRQCVLLLNLTCAHGYGSLGNGGYAELPTDQEKSIPLDMAPGTKECIQVSKPRPKGEPRVSMNHRFTHTYRRWVAGVSRLGGRL